MRDENDMIDDEGAVRLLEPLREEPDPRTGVDVPRAMAEGLRRRRLHRWSSGVAAIAVTGLTLGGGTLAATALNGNDPTPRPVPTASVPTSVPTSAAPAAFVTCAVTRLPTGGVKKAVATAGDPSGRWAAGRLYSTKGHPTETVVWKDGAIDRRMALPGDDADIVDLNSSGAGVANGYIDGEHQVAFRYANGDFTRLRGTDVGASAMNEAGVIVGGMGDLATVPIRWKSATASPEKLPLPPGATEGGASDIADDGTIVGSAGPERKTTGYLWLPDGTGHYLPLPKMRDGKRATAFAPQSISNGWVSGNAILETPDSTSFTPVRYRIATGEYETFSTEIWQAGAVSADGWTVGEGRNSPVVADGARTAVLPVYGAKSKQPGDTSYDIRAISADGHVVIGYKAGPDLGNDPLMWTCR